MNEELPDNSRKKRDSEASERARRRKETLTNLYESAIEAEKDTGRREKTPEKARRSLIIRILSIFVGTVVAMLGLIMFITPGPGLLVLAAGLGILAIDVPFARNLLNSVKKRLPQDETGHLSRQTIATMIVMTTLGVVFSAFSIWKTFF